MNVKQQARYLVPLCLIAVVGSPGLAGNIRHDRSDQQYLDLAASRMFDAVGRFNWQSTTGSGGLASGTLIADQWVLTAGHVVDDPGQTNLEFTLGGETYRSVDSILHPDWTGNIQAGNDLALVKLDRAVTSVDAAKLYTGRDEVGMNTTIVGFGKTGDGFSGSFLPAGEKRAGNNLIGGLGDVVGYSEKSLMADFDFPDPNATGKAESLDLEYLAAPGDSGGGWFLDRAGETLLAGVTSFGYAPDGFLDSGYGDIAGATRVSDYLDWILPIAGLVIEGDYNANGVVDAADYDMWRQSFGSTTDLRADGNADGVVNISDYTIWRDRLGPSVANSVAASVPEPSAGLLAALALAACVRHGRGGRTTPRAPCRGRITLD